MSHENQVELIGHYGGDHTHAMAAWTSTNREMTNERIAQIPGLLKKLAEGSDGNVHGSPFEKSFLHFNVTCDVASHIHILKHRIGVSVNGESARYQEYKEDKFYIPEDWAKDDRDDLESAALALYLDYHAFVADMAPVIGRARAKESARFYLPYCIQQRLDVSFNFRSFLHFQKLRNAPHAQKEIREIAQKMLSLVRELDSFKYSLEAFNL